jgi:hypothetical protein
VKHGMTAIFAGESKQGNKSARLIVRSGSGKKLTAWNSLR